MEDFLFTEGQRVKVKANGEVGTVVYRGTEPITNGRFYQVKFDGGKTELIAEDKLWPADHHTVK
jgi:hypothetical protein